MFCPQCYHDVIYHNGMGCGLCSRCSLTAQQVYQLVRGVVEEKPQIKPQSPQKSGSRRGFSSMSPEKRREIASKGGKSAHASGSAHKWTSEEAQKAGRKGGFLSRRGPKDQK